jgi:hypothetical protein
LANLENFERFRDNKDLEFSCSIYIHNILFPDVNACAFWLEKKQLYHMPMFQPEEKLINTKSKKWKRGD